MPLSASRFGVTFVAPHKLVEKVVKNLYPLVSHDVKEHAKRWKARSKIRRLVKKLFTRRPIWRNEPEEAFCKSARSGRQSNWAQELESLQHVDSYRFNKHFLFLDYLSRFHCLIAIVSLGALLAGCSSSNALTPATIASQADWMASIQGTRPVSDFSIPGSHDSCALREPFPGTARCQALSISAQLSAGIRFLDIRCRHVNDAFEIYHGPIDQHMSFGSVILETTSFLRAHPSECIILSLQEESTPIGSNRTFEQTFDVYVNEHPGIWFLKNRIPTLDEARGHLILLRRFDAARLPKGIDADPCHWQTDTTFWIRDAIRVQDKYIVNDNSCKWMAIQCLFQEAHTLAPDVLLLNFTSGYRPELFGLPNILAVSDFINPKLEKYFDRRTPGRVGIIVMDFVDPATCALIIKTNRPM